MSINLTRREDGPLYAAIEAAGFSVSGFARRMGVVRSTVWRIDRGLQSPTPEWWARAAALLQTPVEDIAPQEAVAA